MNRRSFLFATSLFGLYSFFSFQRAISLPILKKTINLTPASFKDLSFEEVCDLFVLFDVVFFESGDYLFSKPVLVTNTSVEIVLASDAYFRFEGILTGGFRFVACNLVSISGGAFFWPDESSSKRSHYGAGLMFVRSKNVIVKNLLIKSSPGAGFHFDESSVINVSDCKVESTGADGFHFANCGAVEVKNISSLNTGDDGLAFVNYEKKPDDSRPCSATEVNVINSKARGIAIVGQSNVTITNFSVNGTVANGIHCAKENTYNTRIPSNTIFKNGVVKNAGQLDRKNPVKHGLFAYACGSLFVENVSFHRSKMVSFFVYSSEANIRAINIAVFSSEGPAFIVRSKRFRGKKISVAKSLNGRLFFGDSELVDFEGELLDYSIYGAVDPILGFENIKIFNFSCKNILVGPQLKIRQKRFEFRRVKNGKVHIGNHKELLSSNASMYVDHGSSVVTY